MHDFNLKYLDLLKNQVAEEISFLIQNGHNNGIITITCPFCFQNNQGNYLCNRLRELREFQSNIEVTRSAELNKNRKPIGGITRQHISDEALKCLDEPLPQLLQPL